MKVFASTVGVLAVAAQASAMVQDPHVKIFRDWQDTHGKQYETTEVEMERFDVFVRNHKAVMAHNSNPDKTYTQKLNVFADMTPDEFKSQMTGFVVPEKHTSHANYVYNATGTKVASSKDWVAAGKVTAVKNQGQCGSCWAFSTTGSVEAANLIKHGGAADDDANVLSEQQLVDCSTANRGCNGGIMDLGFAYLKGLGPKGDDTESSYPYKARKEWFCHAGKHTPSNIQVTGHVDVAVGDETALLEAVGTHGPCSIAIEADQKAFQFYHSGVLTAGCGQQLDHGVLLAGYGTEDGTDYWLVKNSWGASWGVDGYIKIARGSNLCGIANSASYPIVA